MVGYELRVTLWSGWKSGLSLAS